MAQRERERNRVKSSQEEEIEAERGRRRGFGWEGEGTHMAVSFLNSDDEGSSSWALTSSGEWRDFIRNLHESNYRIPVHCHTTLLLLHQPPPSHSPSSMLLLRLLLRPTPTSFSSC